MASLLRYFNELRQWSVINAADLAGLTYQIAASTDGSVLTLTVKNSEGNTPDAVNPVNLAFRDSDLTKGDPVTVSVTSALSISTNAIGATLGTQSANVPFRLWLVAFNKAGTVVLALWQSVTWTASVITGIASLAPNTLQSTTAISGAATLPGVFYTPNGTTLASKAFRVLGFVDYATGLATAGTYVTAPTTIQTYGPDIKLPNDVIQTVTFRTSGLQTSTSSATLVVTVSTTTITPTSSPNAVIANSVGGLQTDAAGTIAVSAIQRGATILSPQGQAFDSAGSVISQANMEVLDLPGSTAAQTYAVYILAASGIGTVFYPSGGSNTSGLTLREVMV